MGTVLARWSRYHPDRPGTAEIKQLYVAPEHRGHRHARVLMGALEREAWRAGVTRAGARDGPAAARGDRRLQGHRLWRRRGLWAIREPIPDTLYLSKHLPTQGARHQRHDRRGKDGHGRGRSRCPLRGGRAVGVHRCRLLVSGDAATRGRRVRTGPALREPRGGIAHLSGTRVWVHGDCACGRGREGPRPLRGGIRRTGWPRPRVHRARDGVVRRAGGPHRRDESPRGTGANSAWPAPSSSTTCLRMSTWTTGSCRARA